MKFLIIPFILFFSNLNAQNAFCDSLKNSINIDNIDISMKLINSSNDLDCQSKLGHSPLGLACSRGNFEIVKMLYSKGINLNTMQYIDGEAIGTPIFDAVSIYQQALEPNLQKKRKKVTYNYEIKDKIVAFLVKNGANVNVLDSSKSTILMLACMFKRNKIIELLIQKGINIDAQNSLGYTALMYCALYKNYDGIKLLLKFGADKEIRNKENKIAKDIAIENKSIKIQNLLK